ncbi:hypothetical protein IP84_15005 [beta proteobacterium AAP99]|nr:hypothetical protein IP84_15005 [beta proteobacterium AAP99]
MPPAPDWLTTLGLAVVVFASTNIDDILLLAAFFSDKALAARNVVLGQFAGIGMLVAASAAAALLAVVVPAGWIALLGLLPLALGLRALLARWRSTDDEDDDAPDNPRLERARRGGSAAQVVAVAAVTVANGGDNLGIYIPLFATQPEHLAFFVVVFAAMTALWCALGYLLVNNRYAGERVQRVAQAALPWVLIGLGLYILSGARVLL